MKADDWGLAYHHPDARARHCPERFVAAILVLVAKTAAVVFLAACRFTVRAPGDEADS